MDEQFETKNINCLRCGVTMEFYKSEKLQPGEAGILFDRRDNILAGALAVDIYVCPKCGKLEFFSSDNGIKADSEEYEGGDTIAHVTCPQCGFVHDMDYPKCPSCSHNYIEEDCNEVE